MSLISRPSSGAGFGQYERLPSNLPVRHTYSPHEYRAKITNREEIAADEWQHK